MADQFIGLTVYLTLKDDQQTEVRGLVADVVGHELGLRNVFFPQTGHTISDFRVAGTNIQDVEIVKPDFLPPRYAPRATPPQAAPLQHIAPPQQVQRSVHTPLQELPAHVPPIPPYPVHGDRMPVQPPPPDPIPFDDPAIVSVSRKPSVAPASARTPQPPPQPFATPVRVPTAPAMARVGSAVEMQRKGSAPGQPTTALNTMMPAGPKLHHPLSASAAVQGSLKTITPEAELPASATATLQQPFSDLTVVPDTAAESSAFEETDDAISSVAPTPYNQRNKFTGKRSRRGKSQLKKQGGAPAHYLEPIMQEEPSQKSHVLSPGMFGGAIAQAATLGSSNAYNNHQQQMASGRRRRGRRNRDNGNTTNGEEEGWATEDVNDYKERDFDFQSNLDRFDKKNVFKQIKAEDTTADDARLVSFNRLPQRNSVSKKNYHPNENVLGTYANGQSLAERDGWHTPEFIAEQSEDTDDDDDRGRIAESGRNSRRALSRQSISNRRGTRQLSASNARGSMENLIPPSSSGGGEGRTGSGLGSRPGKPQLRLSSSNRPCPVVSPIQMQDVERIAEVELGLTDDMMTENAGRGIAQVAIQAFGKRISATNHNALPVVLVFAGNHKAGSRAIAAGRHLRNHHVRVMVCVLGLEREEELVEFVRRQLNIFRNAGGRVARWEEVHNNLKTLDSPPELIIDGMLGIYHSFEDLRTVDQAVAFELVQFANKGKASVLSVDVPSGIDGSSGEITQLQDTDAFHMRAKWVVCMGAPKSGLLNALSSGLGATWNLFVADIGISNTAWRKYGTRRRHGVEFAADWIVPLQFYATGSNVPAAAVVVT